MPIANPTQLVDEFKKSGEFDRLRRHLLSQFQESDSMAPFKSKVEDIAQKYLASEQKLQYRPQEISHSELMQEMDRYPIVSRAISDARVLSDPAFVANIHNSVQKILHEDKGLVYQPRQETVDEMQSDAMGENSKATRNQSASEHAQQDTPPHLPELTGIVDSEKVTHVHQVQKVPSASPPLVQTLERAALAMGETSHGEKMDTADTDHVGIATKGSEEQPAAVKASVPTTANGE